MAYFEVFQYNKDNSIAPPKNQISYVYKPSLTGKNTVDDENSFDQIIGYRYYKSPGVNILDNNNKIVDQINPNEYFTVLNNKPEHKYEIYEKDNHDCYNIIQTILQDKLKNLKDYEIEGIHKETIGFLTTIQNDNQNQNIIIKIPDYSDLWKCEITKTSDNPEDKNIITYFNSGDTLKILNDEKLTEKQKEQALINKILMDLKFTEEEKQKGLAVIPFSIDGHSTTLMIKLKPETDRKMYIEDFSTYHLSTKPGFNLNKSNSSPDLRLAKHDDIDYKKQIYRQTSLNRLSIVITETRPNLLGKASEYCKVLNEFPIQLNGTCNFWMLAFCQVAKEYTNSDLLLNECINGVVDIKVANKMCELFGMDKLFFEINKADIEDENGNIISRKTKFNEVLIKVGSKYFSINTDIDHLQSDKNFFLNFNYFFEKFEIVNPQNSLEMKRQIIEDLRNKQQERSEITSELGVIQEDIEKYIRKLIRNDPLVLDLKKKFIELNNRLASTSNDDYESANKLYNEIIEFEKEMSSFPKKEGLYKKYKTLLEGIKIEGDFDIKELITFVDGNNIEPDYQKIKNLKAKIETSFREELAKLEKAKSEDSVDNYRVKKINDKRVENLAILKEKEQLSEIDQIQKELLEEQQKSRNEKDDLKIEMLFKKLEAITLLDATKENIQSQKELFDRYLLSAEIANEELENLNLELDIRDIKTKLCVEPSNKYFKIHFEDLKNKEIKIHQNLKLLDEKHHARQSFGFENNDPKILIIKCQQMLWELENKFNRERFIDNRKEYEKSEVIIKSKENLKNPSSQPPLSFAQRKNLRRQQKQRSGSAPARLCH